MRRAVFLDKDGTLVEDVPYNVDLARIVIRPDAAQALARLRARGFALVVVTNQPGIALGRYGVGAIERVRDYLARQLARGDAPLDGFFYCPHHPDGRQRKLARACACRKPRSGLLRRAAAALRVDLARSWMVGDILDDVEAGARAGCRTVLLDVGGETEWRAGGQRTPDAVVSSLAEAAEIMLGRASQRVAA